MRNGIFYDIKLWVMFQISQTRGEEEEAWGANGGEEELMGNAFSPVCLF